MIAPHAQLKLPLVIVQNPSVIALVVVNVQKKKTRRRACGVLGVISALALKLAVTELGRSLNFFIQQDFSMKIDLH